MTTSDIIKLIQDVILPFHRIERHHRLPQVSPRRWENDAEHSWSLAALAGALAPQIDPALDVGKICQYAIVHDLVEIHAGDTRAYGPSSSHQTKAAREHQALERLATDLPQFPWIAQTIREYEAKQTPEAKFVYAVDKYIAVAYDLLDDGECLREIGVTKTVFSDYHIAHRRKAHTDPAVGRYYDEIIKRIYDRQEFFAADPSGL
jgi:putative hydrolase of HD superfamily